LHMTHCHEEQEQFEIKERNILLVGNPNCGKSVIFHKLTGIYTHVSNYPGTTLQIYQGKYKGYAVIDTPGVYGISSINTEENIVKKIILKAHKIINVVNALHLDRELFLTLQLIDMGLPLIVALNFKNEAEKNGIKIDVEELSKQLGVKVIPIDVVKGTGVSEIKANISNIKPSTKLQYNYKSPIVTSSQKIKNRIEYILALESDKKVLKKYGLDTKISADEVYQQRRKRINDVITVVQKNESKKSDFKKKLASLMIHPFFGFFFLALVLYLAYQIVGVFVAQTVVGFTEEIMMQGHYVPYIQQFVNLFYFPSWVNTLLVGEFGILTMPVAYLIGLLLPLVISFYLLLSILEDSGYLPRLAFLIDKWLNKVGLNGKAVIPLIFANVSRP